MKPHFIYLSIILSLFLTVNQTNAQVFKNFKQRTSDKVKPPFSKGAKTYLLKGDFELIGNTVVQHKEENGYMEHNGNVRMKYINIDSSKSDIYNSSSANLKFYKAKDTLITDKNCINIVYAGLYWTGRIYKFDGYELTVNEQEEKDSKLVREKVKLKFNEGEYKDIVANNGDIYFNDENKSNGFYVGYADITDFVQNNKEGKYTVANIATSVSEHMDADGIGSFGGWGIVVVYQHKDMKTKEVSIYDGFVMVDKESHHSVKIDGFSTPKTGNVNVKVGIMASEGDNGLQGDYVKIKKNNSNEFKKLLINGKNTEDDFFKSNIIGYYGDLEREPKKENALGFDLLSFEIENKNNEVIGNSATSTEFEFGTTADVYGVFFTAFSIDSNKKNIIATAEQQTGKQEVDGNQEVEFVVKVYNRENQDIGDIRLEIDLPKKEMAEYVQNSDTASGIELKYDNPDKYPNGYLHWRGKVEKDKTLEIKYKLKTKTQCAKKGEMLYLESKGKAFVIQDGAENDVEIIGADTIEIKGTCETEIQKGKSNKIKLKTNEIPENIVKKNNDFLCPTLNDEKINLKDYINVDENNIEITWYNEKQEKIKFPTNLTKKVDKRTEYIYYVSGKSKNGGCEGEKEKIEIVIDDRNLPTLNTPLNLILYADDENLDKKIEDWINTVKANDECFGNVEVTNDYTKQEKNYLPRTFNVTFKAKDKFGNESSSIGKVQILKQTKLPKSPIIRNLSVCPTTEDKVYDFNDLVTNNEPESTLKWYNNSFSADLATDLKVNSKQPRSTLYRKISRWVSVVDKYQNESQKVEVFIEIIDNQYPKIEIPKTITIDCDDEESFSKVKEWISKASATDNCELLEFKNNYVQPESFCGIKVLDVEFTAVDLFGNKTTETGKILINNMSVPKVEKREVCPTQEDFYVDMAEQVTPKKGLELRWFNRDYYNRYSITTETKVNTKVNKSKTEVKYVCYVDGEGNESEKVIVELRIGDSEKPKVMIPNSIEIECEDENIRETIRKWIKQVTITDNCTQNIEPKNDYIEPKEFCNLSEISINFWGEDAAGNVGRATGVVRINPEKPKPKMPLVSSDLQICPTEKSNYVSLDSFVTPESRMVLRWYENKSSKTPLNQVPKVETNVKEKIEKSFYVSQVDTDGVESRRALVAIEIDDQQAPNLNLPEDLLVFCDEENLKEKIENWIKSASATDNCTLVNFTNNFEGFSDPCTLNKIEVTFCANDIFGNETCQKRNIVFRKYKQNGCVLGFYNAFSPNNDGINDEFVIDGIQCYKQNKMRIFNRWGRLVYQVENYDNQNNVFKGYSSDSQKKRLPKGVYYYVFEYQENGTEKSTSGWVFF